jgi:N-acetylmuramoyl-L-alanine amidase
VAFCAIALLLCFAGPARAESARRAAIDDKRLAAEAEGSLFMEVLAAKGDTAISLAMKYAGTKSATRAIRAVNKGEEPGAGRFYRLPFEILLGVHRTQVLASLFPEEIPRPPLEFKKDKKGQYAVYKLKKKEALYSAVVVRFCGRIEPGEVKELAEQIAGRSAIRNVRKIPAGYRIKIPVDLLLPEFQPPGSPGRLEVEASVAAASSHRVEAPVASLAGVHIILDAGHGGGDSGAVRGRVYEDEHAYDVMCRIRDTLLRTTSAKVVTTIRDKSSGYRLLKGRIGADTDEYLLTKPPYDLRARGATRHGVNKRWQIANKEFKALTSSGIHPDKIVFISVHADSLHKSLRGGMVYVPGKGHRRSLPKGVTKADLSRAEGLSRALAREMISGFRKSQVRVHQYLPIRDHVIRSGRKWIPAVLRVSKVPHSLLVEIVNLNNSEDRRLLVKSSFRQQVADSVVESLVRYYGGSPSQPAVAAK